MKLLTLLVPLATAHLIETPSSTDLRAFDNFLSTDIAFPLIIFYDLGNCTSDYLNTLIRYSSAYSPCYVFVQSPILRVPSKSRLEIIFVDHRRTLHRFLRNSPLDNEKYTKYLFVCDGNISLIDSMDLVWRSGIWNFIFFHQAYNLFYYYNPFTATFVSSPTNVKHDQFKKFRDLNRYRIDVSISVKSSKRNFQFLAKLARILNANLTVKVARDFEENYEFVRSSEVDFSFTGDFYGIHDDVTYMEPIKRNDIMLVAPRSDDIPSYLKPFQFLDFGIWFLIVGFELLFIAIIMALERKDYSGIFITMFGISVGAAVTLKHNKYKLPSRIIILMWISVNMFLVASYSSLLLRNLIKLQNINTGEISTIDELRTSNQSICLSKEFVPLLPGGLNFQIKTRERLVEDIRAEKTDCCYAFMRNRAREYAATMPQYYVIKESLIPGYESLYFKKSSPFVYKVNDIMKRIEAAGLLKFTEGKPKTAPSSFIRMTLEELSTGLIVLCAGLLISLVIFALEVAFRK